MNEKSFVGLEQNQCPICLSVFETGAILLDRRLKESLDRLNMTGLSPCPDCQEKLDDDFVAMIEITPESERHAHGGKIKPQDATYSGRHAFLRRHVALDLFDIEPERINFCDGQLLDLLERMTAPP